VRIKHSLASVLIFWFLVISLVPLVVFSYNSFVNTKNTLTEIAEHELEQSSSITNEFIKNWFYYRKVDIKNWSQTQINTKFLTTLKDEYKKSKKSLQDFTKSFKYTQITTELQNDLITLTRQYDYIYDIFLIDNDGNVLYTIEKEDDLASSLVDGKYAYTKFAKSYAQTMKDGKIHFSDLELYAPSGDNVTGFFTAPIIRDDGDTIGVLAIQIKLERIFALFQKEKGRDGYKHYLVGIDGLSRSAFNDKEDVLKLQINTKQFELWYKEHGPSGTQNAQQEEFVFDYLNPNDKKVFGLHQDIDLFGVKWVLISEVDSDVVLASIYEENKKLIIYFVLTVLLVIFVALFVTRRIVRPIEKLSDASVEFSKGKRDIKIDIKSTTELEHLAAVFNDMTKSLSENETLLTQQTKEVKKTLVEFNELRYALDAHSIVAITDTKGVITYVNKKFQDISGYTSAELIGQNHRILNSGAHTAEFWKNMYKTISNAEVWNAEVCNVNKSGAYYWLDTTIVPFLDENKKIQSYIAIRTDITDSKELEHELIQANETAQASVKAKGEFLASMSHEIRTPMNGVIGMLGLLMNTKLDDNQKHQAGLAQSSAKALLTLINDILDFSKVEAGKMDLEYINFNLRNELGDFAESIGFRAQEKGVELILDLKNIEKNIIKADPGRIRQILSNIVGNSIKFTKIGHILIKADLKPTSESKARLIIEMSDTGIGIPEDKVDSLFDSFSQVDASTTRKYGGTGLGLAIVKKLCELMDGTVKVTSELGVGSTFIVDLEVELSPNASLVMPDVNIKGKTTLIVDDNSVNIQVLKGQLEYWGMKVDSALSAKEALEILKTNTYDIALLDMHMPDMDGEELGYLIREDKKFEDMKMVMMTSLGNRGDASRYADIGFDAYFPKPTTTKDLFHALNVLVDDGEVLYRAEPLVTHDYLNTLEVEEEIEWGEVNILLVDDNMTNLLVANGILEEIGLEADTAKDGLKALDMLLNEDINYDIVLMDCQMPEMDGYDATRAIRAGQGGDRYKNIPVIAMTANAMQGDREKCEAAGMDDYITKPINPDTLKDTLKKYLLK